MSRIQASLTIAALVALMLATGCASKQPTADTLLDLADKLAKSCDNAANAKSSDVLAICPQAAMATLALPESGPQGEAYRDYAVGIMEDSVSAEYDAEQRLDEAHNAALVAQGLFDRAAYENHDKGLAQSITGWAKLTASYLNGTLKP